MCLMKAKPPFTSLYQPEDLCEGYTIDDGLVFAVGGGDAGFQSIWLQVTI